MKYYILGLLATAAISSSLLAKDSAWLVGSDNTVALNVFEHRSGAEARATEITLIMGTWFLNGQLKNSDSSNSAPVPVTLKAKNATFKGTIGIDYGKKKAALKGTLTLQGTAYKLDQKIPCKEMNGL